MRAELGLRLKKEIFTSLFGGGEGWIQAQNAAPMLSALARYRNSVANRNDVRVFSFRLFVESGQCRFYSAENDPTVSNHRTDRCMKIAQKEYCGTFDARGLVLPKDVLQGLESCF